MAAAASAAAAAASASHRVVGRIISSKRVIEGGGFEVRRPFGGGSFIDPFIMFDHFGPKDFKPGHAVGAPDHPHRGQTTVSYILSGEMEHKDSAGHSGKLSAGWVQWMDAANGVVHSETPSKDMMEKGGTMEGFQIWVNLPAKHKRDPPRYQDVPPERIPVVPAPGGKAGSEVRVVAGSCAGVTGPVETRTPITYLDVRLAAGDALEQPTPASQTAMVYIYRGRGVFGPEGGAGPRPASEGDLVLFAPGELVTLRAAPDAEMRAIFLAGEPLKEPVVSYGPFVMNTEEEIMQAFEDYRGGRFGAIDGAEARHADAKRAVAAAAAAGEAPSAAGRR